MELKQPIAAIVFDMDGVLFDTEPLHMKAWNQSLITLGAGQEYDREFYNSWVGKTDVTLGDYLEEKHPALKGEGRVGYHTRKGELFREILKAELVPFPGVPEGLERLGAQLPLAVATSSHRVDIELMLEITGLKHIFQASCTYNDVNNHKPHPEPYLHAAERLGVKPEECIALEDSPGGVKSAKAAGMLTLGIKSTFDAETLKKADYIFSTTVEAIEWIEKQLLAKKMG
ncbi:MAG: HAD family phosphatase [Planctomycetes bacterium]|nr:HAD family phosphatase [Planctomycetota bacterium]